MDYELRCEGFPLDDELKETLLLRGRRIVLEAGEGLPVRMLVRQVDGRVQGRIEVSLPGRIVSAVVWRSDPVVALEAAISAVMDALAAQRSRLRNGWSTSAEVSTLQ
jgi:hypothetical protein